MTNEAVLRASETSMIVAVCTDLAASLVYHTSEATVAKHGDEQWR